MITVASHQPQYLPWPPYFKKIAAADIFVVMDDVQYQKNGLQNRNMIRGKEETFWLTIPVHGAFLSLINAVRIQDGWQTKHIKSLRQYYSKAPYWSLYKDRLEDLYVARYDTLLDANMAFLHFFCHALSIPTRLVMASALALSSARTQRLVDMTKAVGGTCYISGGGALAYLEETLFTQNDLALRVIHSESPAYKQMYNDFIPDLSMLDMLLSCDVGSIHAYLFS